ncbi:MAG TPA: SMP-30/gluconolactonase/LRE family protein, partial [Burkholderiales bacterium]|nr:SMP-30/gluconolactonase/LRE family protein [Burkholderiales bacterium]
MSGISTFRLRASDFHSVGRELSRPECIVAERDGTLWVSDNRAALMRIDPNGEQTPVGSMRGAPNGFAMEADGSFLVANIEDGRFYRQQRDGRHEIVLDTWDGASLGSANFAYRDPQNRMWATVSTRTVPRSNAVHSLIPDGFVLCRTDGTWRFAAGGFCFTNEVRVLGDFLYVAETAKGRVVRLRMKGDSFGGPERYGPAPLFPGAKIDGITFDSAGNLWVTEITRNALVVISPDARAHTVYEDPEGKTLLMPTSITFAGPDLRTALVGSLKMDHLAA